MSQNRKNRKNEKPEIYDTDELFSNSDNSEPLFGEISESKKNNSSYLNQPDGSALVIAPSSGRKSQFSDFAKKTEIRAKRANVTVKPAFSRSSISNSVAITIS